MSKFLKKTTKKTAVLSVVAAVILAAALIVGILCGVKGYGVVRPSAQLRSCETLTVSVNRFAYKNEKYLDEIEDVCKTSFGDLKVKYVVKGEMSGDESEIVYVFRAGANVASIKDGLQEKLNEKAATNWNEAEITVSVNSEKAVSVLSRHYVLCACIAGAVLTVLVFAYVAIRYGVGKGVVTAVCTLLGMALTAAAAILTRIPVSGSLAYSIAVVGMMSAVATLLTMNKIRENEKSSAATELSAEELVLSSVAEKEICEWTGIVGVALIVIGAIGAANVRWFMLLTLIGVVFAAAMGLLYAPSFYLPVKKACANRPARGASYQGAKKTSTKQKKIFVKAAKPVEEAPVEETPVEETPVEETPVEETPVEETPVEEAPVEEAPVEEAE